MRKLILLILLILMSQIVISSYGTESIEPSDWPDWIDPNKVGHYNLHTIIPKHCQYYTASGQYSLKDSKVGTLRCEWMIFPEGAIVDDANAMVIFTPQVPGVYYFGAYLYCKPNDPNACTWPKSRWEMSVWQVPESEGWDVNFRRVVEGSS